MQGIRQRGLMEIKRENRTEYYSPNLVDILVIWNADRNPGRTKIASGKKKALSSLDMDESECDAQQLLDRSNSAAIKSPMPAKVVRQAA